MAITEPTHCREGGTVATSVTSFTWTRTVDAMTNGILVVQVVHAGISGNSVSVKWDVAGANQALTLFGIIEPAAAFANEQAELWHLVSPAAGASKLITVTFSGSMAICMGGSIALAGVDQTTVWRNAAQTANSTGPTVPSITVNTASGDRVIDAMVAITNVDDRTPAAGQTKIWHQWNGTLNGAGSDEAATGATQVMSWNTTPSGDPWGQIAGSLMPAAGGGGGGKSLPFLPGASVARFTHPRRRYCYTDHGDPSPISCLSLAAYQHERAAQHRAFLRAVERNAA